MRGFCNKRAALYTRLVTITQWVINNVRSGASFLLEEERRDERGLFIETRCVRLCTSVQESGADGDGGVSMSGNGASIV